MLVLAGFNSMSAKASDPFDSLVYPIAELGGCQDRGKCEVFCEDMANANACLDFAKAHQLLPEKDIEMGKKMLAKGEMGGPGGCKGVNACKAYCDDIANIKECIIFAEENDLIPPEELEEAKKVIQAIDKGFTPPPCRGKKECDTYCSDAVNMERCISFGEAAGLIPPEEIEGAKKMIQAIKKGATPPPCKGKDACDVYCNEGDHMAQCMEFAIAAGFMEGEEAKEAEKMLGLLKQGIKMPNCKGKEECEAYCQEEAHIEECLTFSVAAGYMKPEDAERARKTGGRGPGGCKSEAECKAFCDNPDNGQVCLEFATQMGQISPDEAQKMMEGGRRMQQGQQIQQTGPGGCKGQEECAAFCGNPENQTACSQFEPTPQERGGQMPPPDGSQSGDMGMPPETYRQPGDVPPEGWQGPPPDGYQPGMTPPEGYQQGGPPPQGEQFVPMGQVGPMPNSGPTPTDGGGGGFVPMGPPPGDSGGAPSGGGGGGGDAPPPQSFLWPLELFLGNILRGMGL